MTEPVGYADVFEQAAIGMVLVGLDDSILRVNRAFCEMLGRPAAELTGTPLYRLSPAEDGARGLELRRQLVEGERNRYQREKRYLHRSGSVLWGQFTCILVREPDGRPLYFIAQAQDITERKAALQALRVSEGRFRSMVLTSSDWYWEQDEELRFTNVVNNDRGQPFDHRESLGKRRWEIPGIEPLEGWEQHRKLLAAHSPFRDFTYRVRSPKGGARFVAASGEPVFDSEGRFSGYHGTARDITERVRSEQALRESEERFRSLTMLSSDWYWEQDEQLRFVAIDGGEKSRRFAGHDTLGQCRWELPFARPLHGTWAEHRNVCESHLPYRDFIYVRRSLSDTEDSYVSVSGEPFFAADGTFRGYRGTARDVTEALAQQQQVQRLNQELEDRVRRRTAQLEAANRDLEAFSYSIAHDLRAPLATLDGFSQLLAKSAGDGLGERGMHYLERIRQAVRHMGELTDGLLALSSLSRTSLKHEPVDLAELARAAVAQCRQGDPDRAVEVVIAPSLPVHGDPRLLTQMVGNLVGNAWKFTGRTPLASIEVGMRAEDGDPVFHVRDNGAGFDMAHAGKLFEAFQRLHGAAEFEGTGIGLAIVHRIVARHGGRIWAQAAPGQGACFHFTLPGMGTRPPAG